MSYLLSSWLGISMEFAFVSILLVCFGKLAVILCSGVFARVYVTKLGLLWGNFQCSLSQRFTVAIYGCAFTSTCSFTVPSVGGILLGVAQFPCCRPRTPVISGWQAIGLQKASVGWSRRHPYLDEGSYHLPNGDLCFPSPSLVRSDKIQVDDHSNCLPITWSCMARVWPCLSEGCCCNWCIWLVQRPLEIPI